jgi:general secretion pathway protein M
MNAISRALAERSPRERAILYAIAAVVAIRDLTAFAWLPLERSRARLATQLPQLRASIAMLEREAEEAKRLRAMPPVAPNPNASLSGSRDRRRQAATGAQVTVLDARTVAVNASDVAFGALLEWLVAAQAAQGLRVESARLEALPVAGRVRGELRLSRS